jgi:ornithine carbamoyltransferase
MTHDTWLPHLLKDEDLTRDQFERLLGVAAEVKAARQSGVERQQLTGRRIAVLFEKPSTRTRAAFEVAIYEQGGHLTYIDPASSHVGTTESIEDTAIVLGRLYDGIAFRGHAHADVEALARHADVPVWNGLTDMWHPTQALADLLTMREHSKAPLNGSSVCFLGDARDNVANSLLTSGAIMGMDVRVACPDSQRPESAVIHAAERLAAASGGALLVTDDVDRAVHGADFLYTDVWVSMGEPREAWAARIPSLLPYRVDATMMRRTGNPAVKLLHCLPSIHDRRSAIGRELFDGYGLDGAEVADDVFRSEGSLVFDQAENRMHTIKAVLLGSLRGDPAPAGAR